MNTPFRWLLIINLFVETAVPDSLWACACGCGVFQVGTRSMFPTHEGGMVYVEYDYQNQNRNWKGDSPDAADNNKDKKIISNFFAVGYQYLFNRRWGITGEIPFTQRYFKTTDEDTGEIVDFTHSSLGDIRLKGIYTGLSEDFSTGLSLGLKLPTGSYKYEHFDPDVQIGSGSTDLLLGAYHMGPITVDQHWDWFTQAEWDQPIIHYSSYVPGSEVDAAVGVYFNHWQIGPVKIAPLAQCVGTHRWSDHGAIADAQNTGFSRVLLAPGLEIDTLHLHVYTDVGFPVYQHTTGDQLVASQFIKLNVSYPF